MKLEHNISTARERILDTASELFYEKGIQTVGVDRVIAEAGVAKMTLYRHFHSKDELVAAYLARRDIWWRERFEKVESADATPHERLLMVFDVLGDWFATADFHGCAFINANAEHAGAPAEPIIRDHKRAMRDMLSRLTREAGIEDPDDVAGELFILMEGAMVTARMEGDPAAAEQARRAAERLIAR